MVWFIGIKGLLEMALCERFLAHRPGGSWKLAGFSLDGELPLDDYDAYTTLAIL